jgi:hypothetical protein
MPDWVTALASAFADDIEGGGSCGSSGSEPQKDKSSNSLRGWHDGTSHAECAVPVVPKPAMETTGTTAPLRMVPRQKIQNAFQDQRLAKTGTSRTTGTTCDGMVSVLPPPGAPAQEAAAIPEIWAVCHARLGLTGPQPGFTDSRWRAAIDDGRRFIDRWGVEAARLGWQVRDVFALHPTAPAARYDAMGIAFLIGGGDVVLVSPDHACIRRGSGHELRYQRRSHPESVLMDWLLRVDSDEFEIKH